MNAQNDRSLIRFSYFFDAPSKNLVKYSELAPPESTVKHFFVPFLDLFGACWGALERPWEAKWRLWTPFFDVFFDVEKEEANS